MKLHMATDCPVGSHTTALGAAVPFNVVDTPGAYVCNWSGHLLRVPDDAITSWRSPVVNLVGNEPLTVTKISDDPDVPLSQAKRLATDLRLEVHF
jgi:hypothetical protein